MAVATGTQTLARRWSTHTSFANVINFEDDPAFKGLYVFTSAACVLRVRGLGNTTNTPISLSAGVHYIQLTVSRIGARQGVEVVPDMVLALRE